MSKLPVSIEIIGQAAQRKMPDGWEWCTWQRVAGGCIIKGAVPVKRITRGKRKGNPNWLGVKRQSVVVSDDEADAEFLRQERETGQCRKCKGTGQQWVSWHHENGFETESCDRCCGTGVAP